VAEIQLDGDLRQSRRSKLENPGYVAQGAAAPSAVIAPSGARFPRPRLGNRAGAFKSMNHAQKYLAQANRHIAELTVQIVRQRVIVKDALGTGQRPEMAESLLDALEGSLRIFVKHRILLLSLQRQPSE